MNKDIVLQSFRNHLVSIEKIDGYNVYTGKYCPNSSDDKAAIFLLDLDEEYNLTEFNSRQENLISDIYYDNDNYLQWNIYYFIARNEVDLTEKHRIENNFEYARKYFLEESSIDDYFSIDKIEDGFEFSIVEKWKTLINESFIHEILKDIPASSVVNNFPSKHNEQPLAENDTGNENLIIRKIENISYNAAFRPYPKEANFKFGKVNLINGVNGVGKTSILESIEQIICGGTRRNPSSQIPNNSIQAVINGVNQSYTRKQANYYHSLDQNWYSSPKARNIKLYDSFNRFNFLNTDAGVEFIKSDTDESLIEALKRLVLGDEYSEIKKKSERVRSGLKPVYNSIKKEIELNKEKIEESNSKIIKYQNQIAKSVSLDPIFELLQSYGLETPSKTSLEIEKSKPTLNNLIQYLSKLSSLKFNFSTLGDAQEFLSEFNEVEQINKSITEIISSSNSKKIDYKKEQDALNLDIELLESTGIYLLNPFLFALEIFHDNYKKATTLNANLLTSNTVISKFKVIHEELIVKNPRFPKYVIEIKENLVKLEAEKLDNEQKLKALTSKLSDANNLITQIHELGINLINIDAIGENCPLCSYVHGKEKLKALIQKSSKIESTDIDINNLINSQSTISTKIDNLRQELNSINELTSICGKLNIETQGESLNKLLSQLELLRSSNSGLNLEIEILETQKTLINENNISIDALTNLKLKLKEKLSLDFTDNSRDQVNRKQEELQTTLYKITESINSLEINTQKEIDLLIQKAAITNNSLLSITSISEYVKNEKQFKDLILGYLDDITKDMVLKPKVSILKAKSDLENILQVSNNFENSNAVSKLLNLEKEQNESIRISNIELQKKISYFQKAIETLDHILGGSEEPELNSFLQSHLKSILDIFKSIHHPKEFKSIELDAGKIYLIDIHNDTRSLSEISTGQRSAFVISVFLSLNMRLKNGPDIVLFDDPISFIDDINALSFIDFLRMFSHKYKRQIFFATANKKLATLFEHKFAYLNDDFVTIKLTRNNDIREIT